MSAILTAVGRAKINSASPLAQVKIKSVAVGSGNAPFDDTILSLQDQKWIGDATHPIKKPDGSLEFSCFIPSSVGGWDLIEWGLIDIDGDLIAYGQLDNAINKPIGLMSLTPYFAIILDDSEQLDLIITDQVNFVHAGLTGRDALDSHPMSAITGLNSALNDINTTINTKDAQNVKITGNQTISGVKTFTGGVKTDYIQSSDNDSVISSSFDGIGISHKTTSLQVDGLNNKFVFSGQLVGDGSGLSRASTSAVGVTQLNNTLTSTATNLALTAAQGKALNDKMLGVGQTWQNVTSSRAFDATYTNTTGRPIQLYIIGNFNSTNLVIGGVSLPINDLEYWGFISVIVPIGATYKLEAGQQITSWLELR